ISTEIGVPVQVALEPELKVVQGLHRGSGQIVELSRFIINSKDRRGRV
ncbi:MAG: rod shape-determining protein, partial [Veillonella tobetsuensis]|nr:rod shape-determining protein [Veillonella tobetsuensis]